jgi:hypothetical protein
MTADKLAALIYSVFSQTDLPKPVVAERAKNAAQALVFLIDDHGRINPDDLAEIISSADVKAMKELR